MMNKTSKKLSHTIVDVGIGPCFASAAFDAQGCFTRRDGMILVHASQ